jgi:hypothetical protein
VFKHSVLALAATASVLTVAIPEQADARTRHHRVSQERIWRGSDGRYHCRRGDGTLGTVIGAAAGAGAGMVIDRHGAAPFVGAIAGGLLGRHIARQKPRCR